MKKTLITLLALGGAAFAADEPRGVEVGQDILNQNLQQALREYQYTPGQPFDFSATVTLSGGAGQFFTISENWHLYSQERQLIGITVGYKPGDWHLPDGTTTETFTDDLVVGESWSQLVGPSPETCPAVTVTVDNNVVDINGQTMNICSLTVYHGDTTFIKSTLLDETGAPTFFDLRELAFLSHASDVVLVLGDNKIDIVNYQSIVPEPTTATLSLLALAGLAARRRRK